MSEILVAPPLPHTRKASVGRFIARLFPCKTKNKPTEMRYIQTIHENVGPPAYCFPYTCTQIRMFRLTISVLHRTAEFASSGRNPRILGACTRVRWLRVRGVRALRLRVVSRLKTIRDGRTAAFQSAPGAHRSPDAPSDDRQRALETGNGASGLLGARRTDCRNGCTLRHAFLEVGRTRLRKTHADLATLLQPFLCLLWIVKTAIH